MFLRVALLSLASVLPVAAAVQAQGAALSPKEDTEIRAALKTMNDGWNNHDMKQFTSVMADDVEWVNVVGMWWRGKDQVYRAHEAYHQTIFKTRQLHEAEKTSVRAIAPDAAVVTTITPADGYTSPSGRVQPPTRDVLTLVFVHRGGKWLVTEGHNTTIVEAAQSSNPVKD